MNSHTHTAMQTHALVWDHPQESATFSLCTLAFYFHQNTHTQHAHAHTHAHAHAHAHARTQLPEAIWPDANSTLRTCSFTRYFGPVTGLCHCKPARPPWLPSPHHPSIFSFPCSSHNDTSHRLTTTIRESVTNREPFVNCQSNPGLCYTISPLPVTKPAFPSFLSSNTNLNCSTCFSSRCHYSKRS